MLFFYLTLTVSDMPKQCGKMCADVGLCHHRSLTPIWFHPKTWATVWSLYDLTDSFLGWLNTLIGDFPSVALEVTFHEALKNSLLCPITLMLHRSLTYCTLDCACLDVCLSWLHKVCASIPKDPAILHMCIPCSHLHHVCGGVSHIATACRGLLLNPVWVF